MRPIPILVLAILVLGLTSARGEVSNESAAAGETPPLLSPLKFDAAIGDAADFALAVPGETSPAPAEQQEHDAQPPHPSAPASTAAEPGRDTEHSLDGLCNALISSAEDNDLPVPFFANLIWQESRLQLDSVSRAGALGIAQFMPEVAAEVGLDDPFDPQQAIPASARFLRALREHFRNLGFVAAAYNAGTHRVHEWLEHHRALPQETRTYVVRVTGRSVETWRKSPVDDSQLTFVRPLPCRKLPAFADLEQAQDRAAQLTAANQQEQQAQDRSAQLTAAPQQQQVQSRAARPTAAHQQRQAHKEAAAPNIAEETPPRTKSREKKPRAAAAEHQQAVKVAHAGNTKKTSHDSHGEAHATSRRQHGSHEKRHIALERPAVRDS